MSENNFKYPNSPSWREAYEIQRLVKYEAPNMDAVSFLYDSFSVSGGQSIDNSGLANWGFWYNTAINENTTKIRVTGFLRDEEYLNAKIDLINAFKIKTDDDNPAYIFLPLYPRLKVSLERWNIDEAANENGQCKIELNLNICAEKKELNISSSIDIETAKENLKQISNKNLEKNLESNFNYDTFIKSINSFTSKMSNIIGMVQGKADYINDMARAVNSISTTIAQGVRTPSVFAEAIQNVAGSISNAVIEIKQAANESVNSVINTIRSIIPSELAKNNEKKVLLQFLNFTNYDTTADAVSFNEINTAKESDNFMKITAVIVAADLIVQADENKEKIKNYLELYTKLEKSINRDNYQLNNALIDLKISVVEELNKKELADVRKIKFNKNLTLLNAEYFLNSYSLRDLNFIEDSFILPKEISYV